MKNIGRWPLANTIADLKDLLASRSRSKKTGITMSAREVRKIVRFYDAAMRDKAHRKVLAASGVKGEKQWPEK